MPAEWLATYKPGWGQANIPSDAGGPFGGGAWAVEAAAHHRPPPHGATAATHVIPGSSTHQRGGTSVLPPQAGVGSRFDPCRSSTDGGIFCGGAYATDAAQQPRASPISAGSRTPSPPHQLQQQRYTVGANDAFLSQLEQAEERYAIQQQQQRVLREHHQQMRMAQQRAAQQRQHTPLEEEEPPPPQQQQQRHQQQRAPKKGILKHGGRAPMARPLGNAPPSPPNERPAAGGYRREPSGGHMGLADYTSSRVLQAPGGASSFILSDGSGAALPMQNVTRPPSPPPSRTAPGGAMTMAAGGASGRPPHAFMDAAGGQLHRRRDPNASSQLGGMFEGSVWG